MASFSFSQTKIALTLGVMLGVTALTAGVIGLNPNQITPTVSGFQQPPPMSSLLEECGNFFWFEDDQLERTNGDIEKDNGVVVPVVPVDSDTKPLTEEAFRYYKVSEIGETIPTVDELLVTAIKHKGFIIWYIPSAKNDALETLAVTAEESGENVMIVPWLGGAGGEDRIALPQARDFAYTSYNHITQSCNITQPYSFLNFIDYANARS